MCVKNQHEEDIQDWVYFSGSGKNGVKDGKFSTMICPALGGRFF